MQSLWIGGKLSLMELLTIYSFLKNGHVFHLYVYDDIETPLPEEVVVKDATDIIDRKFVFSYKKYNQFGHGKGSYSGFSDIFRYKLLHDKGGWWVDMDVTCLNPLDFEAPYYFRKHHELPAVGNVMKIPQGADVMRACYETAFEQVNENNTDWHKPIQILNDHIRKFNLTGYIRSGVSNNDWWLDVLKYLYSRKSIPLEWKFIHWTNENFRAYGMNKENFKIRSTYGDLLIKYGVVENNFSFNERVINRLRYNSIHKLIKGYYKPY